MAQSNPFSAVFSPQNIPAQLTILRQAVDNDEPTKLTLAWPSPKQTPCECISYDRTEEADAATVSANGEDQPTPKALESALRTFRRKEKRARAVDRTVEERSARSSRTRTGRCVVSGGTRGSRPSRRSRRSARWRGASAPPAASGAGGIAARGKGKGGRRRRADPRESVFAMIPIAMLSGHVRIHGAGPQPLPGIDYAKSAQQVFVEVARYIVLERQDLLLWYGERPPCRRAHGGLPSWVPDFGADPAKGGAVGNPSRGMRAWRDELPKRLLKPIAVSIAGDDAPARPHRPRLAGLQHGKPPAALRDRVREPDRPRPRPHPPLPRWPSSGSSASGGRRTSTRARGAAAAQRRWRRCCATGGNRFLRTEGGRFGTSAVEDAACAEGGPWDDGQGTGIGRTEIPGRRRQRGIGP
ncbi:hypothetical protein DL765_008153 [Monosporascus sp. GIB2]|nr:hypothetical protein DL765_008153 [Monosporascus sp. GIB2]